ncbi:MAG: hypothetical protein GX809_02695, partial [Clostridiaceae bacterium]|nr:hypothetical protein [Clostridiaceae bacterium]
MAKGRLAFNVRGGGPQSARDWTYLNAPLDLRKRAFHLEEDADHLTYGKRYERTSPRKNTRAGHDNMKLTKTAKKV